MGRPTSSPVQVAQWLATPETRFERGYLPITLHDWSTYLYPSLYYAAIIAMQEIAQQQAIEREGMPPHYMGDVRYHREWAAVRPRRLLGRSESGSYPPPKKNRSLEGLLELAKHAKGLPQVSTAGTRLTHRRVLPRSQPATQLFSPLPSSPFAIAVENKPAATLPIKRSLFRLGLHRRSSRTELGSRTPGG